MKILVVIKLIQQEVYDRLRIHLRQYGHSEVYGAVTASEAKWWLQQYNDFGLVIIDISPPHDDDAYRLAEKVIETGWPVVFFDSNPLLPIGPSQIANIQGTIHYCRFQIGKGENANPGMGAFMREITEKITQHPAVAVTHRLTQPNPVTASV